MFHYEHNKDKKKKNELRISINGGWFTNCFAERTDGPERSPLLPDKQINAERHKCGITLRSQRCEFTCTHRHKHTYTHTYTVSFSHANLTYESSWLCFNAAPPLPSPPFPSHRLTIHVTDGCCRQPQSYCCFLSLSRRALSNRWAQARFNRQFVISAHIAAVLQSEGRKWKLRANWSASVSSPAAPAWKCLRHSEASIFFPVDVIRALTHALAVSSRNLSPNRK